ncbi:hypothetical protein B0H10DRAFT_1939355 [Mycena sp. CBHHK59/15]|nr:hypothetical protein B0H10DRAFT_1939355 [Mycena sp. CBHHK59/15]
MLKYCIFLVPLLVDLSACRLFGLVQACTSIYKRRQLASHKTGWWQPLVWSTNLDNVEFRNSTSVWLLSAYPPNLNNEDGVSAIKLWKSNEELSYTPTDEANLRHNALNLSLGGAARQLNSNTFHDPNDHLKRMATASPQKTGRRAFHTMNCQFSFGPNNAYFCKSDTNWAWSDNNTLSEPLRRVLEDPDHPFATKFPYDVAFPMELGLYSMCWKAKDDCDYSQYWTLAHRIVQPTEDYLGSHYIKLGAFMGNGMTSHTVFGPYHGFFSSLCWQNLPPALATDIMGRLKRWRLATVALGVCGAYVVLYDDGVHHEKRKMFAKPYMALQGTQVSQVMEAL